MKYFPSFCILLVIAFVGDLVSKSINISASIIAMVVLFVLLLAGILKERHVASVGDVMVELLPLFIVPSSISIVDYFGLVQDIWVKVFLVCAIGVFITFFTSFYTVKIVMKLVHSKELQAMQETEEER